MRLRSHLIALVTASLLPVIIFAGIIIYTSYSRSQTARERGIAEATRALSLAVDREIEGFSRVLYTLASSRDLDSGNLQHFYVSIRDAVESRRAGQSIALVSPSGEHILNSRFPFGIKLPPPVALAVVKKIIETRNPAVSNLFFSPVVKGYLIVVGVPVIREETLRYVLALSITPDFLTTLLLQQKLPSSWTATIVDGNGVPIARTRRAEDFIGKQISPHFRSEIGGSTEGLFRGTSGDGISVYTAFHRSPVSGWTMAMGVPVGEVQAPLRMALGWMAIGGLILVAVAMLITGLLAARITQATDQLAAGARSLAAAEIPRTPPSPILELEIVRREIEAATEQRHQMEAALRRNEANLVAAQHLARIGSWSRDLATGIVTWSDEIFDIFGIRRQDSGQSYDSFLERIHPKDRAAVRATAENAFIQCRPFTCEYRIIRPDGAVRVIHEKGSVILDNDKRTPIRFFGTAQDVTERNQVEQGLRRSRSRLRALAVYLQSVREQERTQIAHELHDEVGQALTAIKLSVERTMRDGDDVSVNLRPVLELTNELMGRVRDLSLDLRPAMLDDLGLLPALKWLAGRYERQFKINVDFKHAGFENRRFAAETETAAYRIVQEGLTNVARYAGVDTVAVAVEADQHTLRITIADAGVGYVPDSLSDRENSGLSGMRERAISVGGRLDIVSWPGTGTTLKAELPVGGSIVTAVEGADTEAHSTEEL